jgi:hypothetical protein
MPYILTSSNKAIKIMSISENIYIIYSKIYTYALASFSEAADTLSSVEDAALLL